MTERVLFSLVANRALALSSKLVAENWVTHDVHVEGMPVTGDNALQSHHPKVSIHSTSLVLSSVSEVCRSVVCGDR